MPYVSGLGIFRRATNWGADGSYTYIYMYISKIRSDVTVFRERGAVMFDLRWCPYQLAINPMVGGVILIAEFGGQWGWKIVSIHISHDCFEKKLDG